MALGATIYKAELQVSDMDRHYYGSHSLTLACHPSETTERMMLRLLAFACHAGDDLAFSRGVSADDEPDLWAHHDHGQVRLWIELGLPEERRMRQACGKADEVVLYAYGGRAVSVWWKAQAAGLSRLDKLTVRQISAETLQALDAMTSRTMSLSCTIQDGVIWVSDGTQNVEVSFETLHPAAS